MPPVRGRVASRRLGESESTAVARKEEEAPAPASTLGSGHWEQEMEDIIGGTHPQLIAELEVHEKALKSKIAQADAVRQRQVKNIMHLYECEKKRVEDEYRAQMEYFESTLADEREEQNKKTRGKKGSSARDGALAPANGGGGIRKSTRGDKGAGRRPSAAAALGLSENDVGGDLDEMLANAEVYTERAAKLPAAAAEELRVSAGGEVWFDRNRHLMHCHGYAFERGASLVVYQQGQRVDQTWTLTAMNAVECTLRDTEGNKFKVTLAQLRNGRYALHPPRIA